MAAAPKKRGARPIPAAEPVGPVLDAELLAERQQRLAVMNAHQRTVIDEFGDGLPWSPAHYETEIRHELRRGCEAFLRAGRYLVVARECSAHGEWQEMLDRLGLHRDQACRMMEAARRISSNVATSQHLIRAAGNQSKLIELLSLPEDQFAELAAEGETGGLDIAAVERMTVGELRAAVREAKADAEAKDKNIERLSTQLNRAEEKVSKARQEWKRATPDEQSETLLKEVQHAARAIQLAIAAESEEVGLGGTLHALITHAEKHELNVAEQVAGLIANLINDLRMVRDRDDIRAMIIMDKSYPAWLDEAGRL